MRDYTPFQLFRTALSADAQPAIATAEIPVKRRFLSQWCPNFFDCAPLPVKRFLSIHPDMCLFIYLFVNYIHVLLY